MIRASAIFLMMCVAAGAQDAPAPAARTIRKPKISWTLQFGLAHSDDDAEHYAVSGFQGRFPLFVRFVAAALTVKGIGARVEAAQLNSGGSRVNASGLRWGFTVR